MANYSDLGLRVFSQTDEDGLLLYIFANWIYQCNMYKYSVC